MARNLKPRKKSAKISPKVEQRIVDIALQYPDYGGQRLLPLLKKDRITVSASTVYRILKRHHFQTRVLRLLELEKQQAGNIPSPVAEPVPLPQIADALPLPLEIPAAPLARAKPAKRRHFIFFPVYLLLLVMVAYLGVQAYQNIQHALAETKILSTHDPASIRVAAKSEVAVQTFEDYRSIWERNLFNLAEDPSLPPENEIATDPIAPAFQDLGLELVGTVIADDPNLSLAIVANHHSRDQETYYEGDRAGTVQIKKILRNKVIITTDRGDELLMIDVKQSAQSQDALPAQLPTLTDLASAEPEDSDQPVAIRRRTFNLKREDVEKSLSDLTGLMEQLNISPNPKEDQSAGFKISNIPVRSILRRMGLRNRDVITAVNDQPITGPEQAAEFFVNLRKAVTSASILNGFVRLGGTRVEGDVLPVFWL
jgi:type II secretion system protein C